MTPILNIPDRPASYAILTIALSILAFAVFGGLSEHMFEGDDFEYVAKVAAAQDDFTRLFAADQQLSGRPAVDLVFWAIYPIGQDDPGAYHIAVVFLHALAAWMLAFVLRAVGCDLELSFLTAVLFFLDVSHFRAVHWIACLAYPMALLLCLLGLQFLIRFLGGGRIVHLVLSALCMGFAVLSHMASLGAFGLYAYLAWQKRRRVRPVVQLLILPVGICAIAGFWVYLLSAGAPQIAHAEAVKGHFDVLGSAGKFIWFSGRLFSTPFLLASDLTVPHAIDWGLGAGLSLLVLYLFWKRVPVVAGWGLWLVLMVAMFVFNPGQTWLANGPSRYLYFASAGSAMLFVWLARNGARALPIPNAIFPAFYLTVIAALGWNAFSLHRAEAITFYLSGRGYLARSHWEPGLAQIARGIRRDPGVVPEDAYWRYGTSSLGLGIHPGQMLGWAPEAVRLDPYTAMLTGVAELLDEDPARWQAGKAQVDAAFNRFDDPDAFRRDTALAYRNLASYLLSIEAYERAVVAFYASLSWQPGYFPAQKGLVVSLIKQGRIDDAERILDAMATLYADDVAILEELAATLEKMGYETQAKQVLQQRDTLILKQPEEMLKEALKLRDRGRPQDALAALLKIVQVNPEFAAGWRHLADALFERGEWQLAARAYRQVVRLLPEDRHARDRLAQMRDSGNLPREK